MLAISLLLAAAFVAPARDASAAPAGRRKNEKAPRGLVGSLWIEEGYTDNLRLNPSPRLDAWFTSLAGELEWHRATSGWLPHRLGGIVGGRIYGGFPKRDYAVFGPAFGYDFDPFSLNVSYTASPHHLRVDPADGEEAFADVHELELELRARFGTGKRWMAALLLESEWDEYDRVAEERTFFEETVEAGLRLRLTNWLTPRVAVSFASRDAVSSNFDREDAGVLAGFDIALPARVRAIFRYEKTWRNYLVGYPEDSVGHKNNNFGREDDVHDIETGLDVPLPYVVHTSVQMRYRWRQSDSTREGRSYVVNEATLRFVYAFD